MNNALITNWNALVDSHDTVYYLGDLCFPRSEWQKWLSKLKGNIIWIRGNHDEKVNGRNLPIMEIKLEGQQITLCHYAMRTWRNSCHGSWHLYAHSHGTLPPYGLSFDVGVDCHDYKPFSFEEVKTIMNERFNTIDRKTLGLVD